MYATGQTYGYDPFYGGNSEHFHYGMDFLMPLHVSFCAVAAGTVVIAADDQPTAYANAAPGAWGTYVEIDHGGGLHSGYCHLDVLSVRVGQLVQAGQVLGTIGITGLTFGPHGHLQALDYNLQGVADIRVDPALYLG